MLRPLRRWGGCNMFKLAKFFIEHMVKDALTSAGNEIGTAIGKRLSKHIHTEPEEKDDEEKKPSKEKPEPDDEDDESEPTVH